MALAKRMHGEAVAALNAQAKAMKGGADAETARDTALSFVAAKDEELVRVRRMADKLQQLCRELQKQNKLVRATRHELRACSPMQSSACTPRGRYADAEFCTATDTEQTELGRAPAVR